MARSTLDQRGIHPGLEVHLHERDSRIIKGLSPPAGAVELGFRRVVEQVLDHGGDSFAQRVFQEAFAAARALDPSLSPERFLAGLRKSSQLYWLARELLGPASLMLLTATRRGEFEQALKRHYDDFRYVHPPYDGGLSYGAYRYLEGWHVDLAASRVKVLPANTPRFDRRTGLFLYPDYGTVARQRLNRSVAAVQASRVWGRAIPLDLEGKELFEALEIEHSLETFANYLDPELRQSRLQIAFTLSTGYPPIYRSAIVPRGADPPTGLRLSPARNAEQARWELAARLGSHLLDPATDLKALRASLAKGGTRRPASSIPHDPFSQLSDDELFALALRRPDAPRVYTNVFEWEHHRSQRFTKEMLGMIAAMRLGPVWRSRIQMLTGLCEPENLHFVSPPLHAALDLLAAGYAPPSSRKKGEFKHEAYSANRARQDRFGNTFFIPADAAPDPDYVSLEEKSWRPRRFPNLELKRAEAPLVAYEPRHVIALLTELQHADLQMAARALNGAPLDAWNHLVEQLNAAANVYGISKALWLPIVAR